MGRGYDSGLSPCLLYSVIYFNKLLYVVCYQLVTRNSNNINSLCLKQRAHTPTPISRSPANSNFESDSWIFSQTHVSGGVSKII